MTGFLHPEYLVGADWLADHLDDPAVVILDCTTYLIPKPAGGYDIAPGRAQFEQGHIRGAQFCDVSRDVSDVGAKLPFMRPSSDQFQAAMRAFGVGEGTKVVTYSATSPQWASRVWWLLREFGHDDAAVLDGGLKTWLMENRPVKTGLGAARGVGSFVSKPSRGLMADRIDVRDAIGNSAVCTLNALSAEQHHATGGTLYGRPGRIAGSLNVPAAHLIDPASNKFLAPETLRETFDAVRALDREVIVYCGGGIAATADALILTMLGHERVRVYDASLSEWAKDDALPMETG